MEVTINGCAYEHTVIHTLIFLVSLYFKRFMYEIPYKCLLNLDGHHKDIRHNGIGLCAQNIDTILWSIANPSKEGLCDHLKKGQSSL
jgi:hypothetical protein